MKNIIHALVLLPLLAVITTESIAENPPVAYEGRRLYVSYCQLCHGTAGKGDGPLAKAMKISQAEVEALVSYIRLLSR